MHPSTGAAPRRRLFVSIPRAAAIAIERLEPRRLFAVTLPAGFAESLVVSGFGEPTDAAFAPDGRIFITEKSGAVRLFDHGSLHSAPFLTVPVDTYRDRGLDAILLDPNFTTNGFLYLYYTKADPSQPNTAPNAATNRLSRFRVDPADPHHALAGSETVLIDNIPSNTGFHIGGLLEFGPDGKIYLGTGDGGPAFGQATAGIPSYAQDLSNLAGKVLRINPDGSIPSDNPFAGQAGARGEIWAYGLRNPFSGAVNPTSGLLYANDVGQAAWEEINDIRKGLNYGWPGAEGMSADAAYTNAVVTYSHDPLLEYSACVTGGTFYTGSQFPTQYGSQFPTQYAGDYFFADFVQGWMKTYDPATGQATPFATGMSGVIRIKPAADGSLYYLAHDSRSIQKISYVGAGTNRPPTAVATAIGASGLSPLTVQFSGETSSDPDGDSLTHSWDFGDGTTGAGRTVSHTYTGSARTFSARLSVTDGRGGSAQSTPLTVTLGNRAPQATLSTPAGGTLYTAGDTITFSGTGSDPEDGSLPASAFRWSVVFHHHDHTHGFIDSIAGVKGGTFTIPTDGEVSADQWYRIHLTVTDSGGLEHTSFVDVLPRTSLVTLATSVPGLTVTLDGQPQAAPATFTSVAGMVRTLAAPPTQVLNGVTYIFSSWSDGGAAAHAVSTPVTDATYTASYVIASPQQPFGGTPVRIPGRVEAEQFDDGGEGVSWHEVFDAFEPAVSPYRNGGVDLEPVGGDPSSGYNVGYVKAGEWLEYTVDVAASGGYDIEFRVANKGAGGVFHLEVDGVGVTGPLEVPDTGDWQSYTSITRQGVTLGAGRHVLRLVADAQNAAGYAGNFDWFQPRATFELPPQPPLGQAGGLRATYFDDAKMKVSKVTRIDPAVDFNWGAGSPDPSVGADTFTARWTGQVRAESTGHYTFTTESDDGVRLWVNGQVVINNWKRQKKGPALKSGTIPLTAGQKYDVRLEYFDNTGNAVARLLWTTPGGSQAVIPATHLSPQSPVRVNAGGGAYTDRSRNVFAADMGFSGGKVSKNNFAVSGTTDDRLYSAQRAGQSFSYTATGLVDGTYTLRLHFADPVSTAPGQRIFDVSANGDRVLQGVDAVAEAGPRTALVRNVIVTVEGGRIDVLFMGVVGDAIVSAIELLPA
jgi:glucose/arabinose dehydrogenase